MNLGVFVNAVISFMIVAFAVFILIKAINKLQAKMDAKEKKEEVATTKKCPYCCSEIAIAAVKCPNCTSDLEVKKAR